MMEVSGYIAALGAVLISSFFLFRFGRKHPWSGATIFTVIVFAILTGINIYIDDKIRYEREKWEGKSKEYTDLESFKKSESALEQGLQEGKSTKAPHINMQMINEELISKIHIKPEQIWDGTSRQERPRRSYHMVMSVNKIEGSIFGGEIIWPELPGKPKTKFIGCTEGYRVIFTEYELENGKIPIPIYYEGKLEDKSISGYWIADNEKIKGDFKIDLNQ